MASQTEQPVENRIKLSSTKCEIPPRLRHRSRCSESESTGGQGISAGEAVVQTHIPIQAMSDPHSVGPESNQSSRSTKGQPENNKKKTVSSKCLKFFAFNMGNRVIQIKSYRL